MTISLNVVHVTAPVLYMNHSKAGEVGGKETGWKYYSRPEDQGSFISEWLLDE